MIIIYKVLLRRFKGGVTMNNAKRFDGKGELYAKARPKYAKALFDYMKGELNIGENSIFADIGSGTGIFTEQLLELGCYVYAVEPNTDMRGKAEERLSVYSKFNSVNGIDDNTNLPDCCVDYVTAAQSFHWFDTNAFKKECRRILKPDGKVIIVYNSRDTEAECTKALAELRKKYNSEFHGFSNGISDEACRAFFDNKCDVYKCDNSLTYNRQGYIDRLLSSSYSLKEDDLRFTEYIESINKLFDRFAAHGIITVPTNTVAYIGSVL